MLKDMPGQYTELETSEMVRLKVKRLMRKRKHRL